MVKTEWKSFITQIDIWMKIFHFDSGVVGCWFLENFENLKSYSNSQIYIFLLRINKSLKISGKSLGGVWYCEVI